LNGRVAEANRVDEESEEVEVFREDNIGSLCVVAEKV
jgi:hypothetical protein